MIDIKHTEDGDIDLTLDDLILWEPTEQHQRDLLLAGQGHYKESPEIGVDSLNFIRDSDPSNYLRTIRKQFTRDGMRVRSVDYRYGQLEIDAYYENH